MSDRVGEVTGRHIENADVLLAPIIAVQGLRSAYAATRRTADQIKYSIEGLPGEVTAPDGHRFAVHYVRNPRTMTGGNREIEQGVYTPPAGIHPPILEQSERVIVRPEDPPFQAVTIAAGLENLLAVGLDGTARRFYPDKGDQVELVPIPTEQQASTAQ
jgi:hypothetical protein